MKNNLPLQEVSIDELYISGEKCVYEIPIYQRNYAWEKEEIAALIQDVYDSYKKSAQGVYYIGTLVTFNKGDRVFEVIDGQQRLTTIRIILGVLGVEPQNKLTYRARKKSDDTIKSIPKFNTEEIDKGIENGFKYAQTAIQEIVGDDKSAFENYFRNSVHIIHYRVPKSIDLNHYFEVMNSRGEQLEKHEIVKANLMQKLPQDEQHAFNTIWECCSEMSVYIQQNAGEVAKEIFGENLCQLKPQNFNEVATALKSEKEREGKTSIKDILDKKAGSAGVFAGENEDKKDSFQPIIDFPNFLLIVLKYTLSGKADFKPAEFNLDDKELLNEFTANLKDADSIRVFAYNLLKMRFLLDNYVVHHSKEEDTIDSNPWKLQVWRKDKDTKKGQLDNLCEDKSLQDKLVHLLSMFEVSFTARQRKNYLFYALTYLMEQSVIDTKKYAVFLENLAERYYNDVYLGKDQLNAINTPIPRSFDDNILENGKLKQGVINKKTADDFKDVFGDGTIKSKGVPLFIFNYLDYKLWAKYDAALRGEKLKEGSKERKDFFDSLGCPDFGLKFFVRFYFSRTRRSLEHYYPQASADGQGGNLNRDQINCFGNYAMIGGEANSAGSNWSPKTKIEYYLDKKTNPISVGSPKFMVMMQACKDKGKWGFDEIKEHQNKMVDILRS